MTTQQTPCENCEVQRLAKNPISLDDRAASIYIHVDLSVSLSLSLSLSLALSFLLLLFYSRFISLTNDNRAARFVPSRIVMPVTPMYYFVTNR